MAGWECSNCGGSGYEEVTTIRRGDITTSKEECSMCFGAGTFTNGKPDVDWDCGVTDDVWRLYYENSH